MGRPYKHPTMARKVGVLIEEYVLERLEGEDLSLLINDLLKQHLISQDAAKFEAAEKEKHLGPYERLQLEKKRQRQRELNRG